MNTPRRIVTFGTFDLFHIGHLRLLQRAKALGGQLIVGVSTDQMNYDKKQRYPVFDQTARRAIVGALSCVDETFFEESLALKDTYLRQHRADMMVMGDDWAGRFDEFGAICEVRYLPRTSGISTSFLIDSIIQRLAEHK